MKIFLPIIFICFLYTKTNAQVEAIGHTEQQITEYLASLDTHETLLERKVEDNGVVTLRYNNKNLMPRAYFLIRDTCVRYMVGGLLGDLPDFIQTINKTYKKTSVDTWVDFTYTYKLTLHIDNINYYALIEKL